MKILRSFKYAFTGIRYGLEEHNMRFHVTALLCVVILGFVFSISMFEWIAILLASGLVITTELINTALEEVCDMVTEAHPNSYDKAGKPKDLSAGAVLIASFTALGVGLIIFIPYFMNLFV